MPKDDKRSLFDRIKKIALEGLPVEEDPELKRLRKKAKGRPSRNVRSTGRNTSKQMENLEKE